MLSKQRRRGAPRKSGKQRNRISNGIGTGIPRPPAFVPSLKFRHSFRWSFISGGGFAVTSDDILNWYIVATAATTSARIISALRMRRFRLWGVPASTGSSSGSALSTTISIEFPTTGQAGTSFAPSVTHSDQALGFQNAYLDVRTSKDYLAGWWLASGLTAQSVFNVIAPTGSILEIECDLVLVDNEATIAGPTLAGATLGRIYGGTLEGANANITPIGLTTAPY